jgi:hypothetical protein
LTPKVPHTLRALYRKWGTFDLLSFSGSIPLQPPQSAKRPLESGLVMFRCAQVQAAP